MKLKTGMQLLRNICDEGEIQEVQPEERKNTPVKRTEAVIRPCEWRDVASLASEADSEPRCAHVFAHMVSQKRLFLWARIEAHSRGLLGRVTGA